jgi:hypothetical protein
MPREVVPERVAVEAGNDQNALPDPTRPQLTEDRLTPAQGTARWDHDLRAAYNEINHLYDGESASAVEWLLLA